MLPLFDAGTATWGQIEMLLASPHHGVRSPAMKVFCDRVGMSIYEIGDAYPGRLPVPFMGSDYGDSLLRVSSVTGSLVLFQSPQFLRHFLRLFIDQAFIDWIGALSIESICDLHCCPFWRGFLDEYHTAIKSISARLGGHQPEESIEVQALEELSHFMRLRDNREVVLAELLYGALFTALQIPFLSFSPAAMRWLEAVKKKSHMMIAHPDVQRFLDWVVSNVNTLRRRAI